MKADTKQLNELEEVLVEILTSSLQISKDKVKTILANVGARLYFGKEKFDKMLNESLNETKTNTK